MGSRKFVRCGPYKLYRDCTIEDSINLSPWSARKTVVTTDCWAGPGEDGDRIMLIRHTYTQGDKDYYHWEVELGPIGDASSTGDFGWNASALNKSPKVAAEKLWQFIEGVAGIYVDTEGWANE